MVAYNTEEEQIEALKNWWNENGTQLLVTIAVSLALVFGYRGWESRVQSQGESASTIYEEFRVASSSRLGNLTGSNDTTARYLLERLVQEHEDSIYASLASLQMAKLEVGKDNLEQAENDLKWVVVHADSTDIKALAKMRLARVVAARGEAERALELLNAADAGSYQASYAETRGDILLQLNRAEEARQAYQEGIAALPTEGANPILQMKLDNIAVGADPVPTAAESAPVADDTDAGQ